MKIDAKVCYVKSMGTKVMTQYFVRVRDPFVRPLSLSLDLCHPLFGTCKKGSSQKERLGMITLG